MNVVILGEKSDIAKQLRMLMVADGWKIRGWSRWARLPVDIQPWDLVLIAIGRIAPVNWWCESSSFDWDKTMESNLLLPLRLLRTIWHKHNTGASICWLAGSNPNMIMDGYSAYNVSKMAVLKAVEQLDHETPDAKFFALGPGIVLTKIHQASRLWPNPKLAAAIEANQSVPIERIYECMKWCLGQAKEVVGGRNICVSDELDAEALRTNPDRFKLRRNETR